SVRATRYAQTRGPDEFAQLSNAVTMALNDIAVTADPQRRGGVGAGGRQNGMQGAADHYGYRAKDVAEMAGLFDKAIADTRAAGGASNFGFSLVADMGEAPSVALLPVPSLRE